MSSVPLWCQFLGLCAVFPISFFGTVAVIFWLTDADPLVQEIWNLRGHNSLLRERLAELEGQAVSDTERLRRSLSDD